MQNLTAWLAFHARRTPGAEALVYGEQRIGYAELEDRALRMAGFLAARGVGPDTIVALLMKNSAAFLEAAFAVSHLGAVLLPMNFRLAADEIAYIVDHAGAGLVLADQEFEAGTRGLSVPVVHLDTAAQADTRALAGRDGAMPPAHPRGPDDMFRLMYTSGTTDRPKGVMHSYGNLYWKNIDHVIALQIGAADRLCAVGPLYHVGAFDLPGISVLWMGGTIVVMRDYSPEGVLETIGRERITGIWLAPVMTNGILALEDPGRFDVSSLGWCVAGGEKTPETRIRAFAETFPNARYVDAYGLTEACSGDTMMEAGREIEKIGSTGRALPHVELQIRDDDGAPVAAGTEGEICLRGAKVTRGYWRDPDKTAAAFWPEGWLRTGDVGYLDADGFLFITDRKKDLIISGGENIASSEVERVIYELPEVLEAAVVGRPDPKWGERPVAVVALREGASLDFARLDAHCRSRLARFKVPREMHLVPALPRNPSGKVLKRVIREELAKS